jgi:hypothetical protein
MGLQKYISDVKTINWNNEIVYDRLSNFEFLNQLFNPENLERAKAQMGDKADKINIENFMADRDSCNFTISPIGQIRLRIIEREHPKTIKITNDGGPMEFTIWIQLLPVNNSTSKLRLTIHTELNMMMKMMMGKKLKQGVNQIADAFTQIPFGAIPI